MRAPIDAHQGFAAEPFGLPVFLADFFLCPFRVFRFDEEEGDDRKGGAQNRHSCIGHAQEGRQHEADEVERADFTGPDHVQQHREA